MRRFCFFLAFALFSFEIQAKECIDWAQVFAKEKARKIPAKNLIINVSPFRNDTGEKSDDWIATGLQYLLIRYLNTDPGITALAEATIPKGYSVGGLFQHTENWLRFFVQLKNQKGEMLLQFPIETPFPLHKRFFTGLREASETIFKKLERSDINTAALQAIENETGNVHAYENFIKGRLALETYNPDKIEVALIWFQEAKREDYKYVSAYQGMIATYEFQTLNHKQKGESFQTDLEAIEKTIQEKNRWQSVKQQPIENRFLNAHVHDVTAGRALAKNETQKAIDELKKSLELVPEDAQTAYVLAESYAKLKSAEREAFYRSLAEGINPCLKK